MRLFLSLCNALIIVIGVKEWLIKLKKWEITVQEEIMVKPKMQLS